MRCPILVAAAIIAGSGNAFAAAEEQGCSYAITPLTVSVSGAGGTGQINVVTGAACSWTASTGAPWLSLSPSSGVGNGSVTWVAAPNTLGTQRFSSMLIAGRAVFISQTQPAPTAAAPGAPRQLAASISGSSVTLTWSPPDSGGAPSTYVLAAGSASGASNLANFSTGNTQTTFSANNVPNGVYFARVRAQNAAGTSPSSNEVTFTVSPQACSATPPSALQSAVSGSLVTLTWAPTGVVASSYVLEVGSSASLTDLGVFNSPPATSFAGNAPPGTYFVRVRAITPCGVTAPTPEIVVVVQP